MLSLRYPSKGVKEYFIYDRVVTELYRYKEDKEDYYSLRLKKVVLNVNRKKCPKCKKWMYPEQELLKDAFFDFHPRTT